MNLVSEDDTFLFSRSRSELLSALSLSATLCRRSMRKNLTFSTRKLPARLSVSSWRRTHLFGKSTERVSHGPRGFNPENDLPKISAMQRGIFCPDAESNTLFRPFPIAEPLYFRETWLLHYHGQPATLLTSRLNITQYLRCIVHQSLQDAAPSIIVINPINCS